MQATIPPIEYIVSLRFLFNGKGYFKASRALEDVLRIHTGLRKDKVTPEYMHQLMIAHYLRTIMPYMIAPEETFICSLLHDAVEDHPDKMSYKDISDRYGEEVKDGVYLLTKTGKTDSYYFEELRSNPIASLVKGADRMHNFQTMVGVFSSEKQLRYIEETEKFIIPMLEYASLDYPEQEPGYANILLVLKSQIGLLKEINKTV